ncbi:MAG: serine/threonine protein kinase [Planctomycetota bacterium]|nr:MAG: serine/threonine protein kinase [Planctomycetota bacterium]
MPDPKRTLPKDYIDKTLKDDYRFGKALIERGHITEYQFNKALANQKRLIKLGKLVRLAKILIKRDMISYGHAEEAFEVIGEPRKFCRVCGNRYRPGTERRACTRCNTNYPSDNREFADLLAAEDEREKKEEKTAGAKSKKGKKFGKFVLYERIGQGGMGIIHRGYDTENERPVALKILLPWLTKQEQFRNRFRVEVTALKKIDHPNAVRFYEAGKADRYLYCAMELLRGKDLSMRLEDEGPIPVDEVINVLWNIAQVLDYGYTSFAPKTFIHRDIKPHNIFACDDGSIRLMDFGLARSRILFEKSITEKGDVFGTVPYMSPEQTRGEKGIDIRSDIFSLGSTAYHILSGELPFPSEDINKVKKEIRRAAPVPIRRLIPELPREISSLLKKMMAREPAGRFQTPAELLAALGPLAGEEKQTAGSK